MLKKRPDLYQKAMKATDPKNQSVRKIWEAPAAVKERNAAIIQEPSTSPAGFVLSDLNSLAELAECVAERSNFLLEPIMSERVEDPTETGIERKEFPPYFEAIARANAKLAFALNVLTKNLNRIQFPREI